MPIKFGAHASASVRRKVCRIVNFHQLRLFHFVPFFVCRYIFNVNGKCMTFPPHCSLRNAHEASSVITFFSARRECVHEYVHVCGPLGMIGGECPNFQIYFLSFSSTLNSCVFFFSASVYRELCSPSFLSFSLSRSPPLIPRSVFRNSVLHFGAPSHTTHFYCTYRIYGEWQNSWSTRWIRIGWKRLIYIVNIFINTSRCILNQQNHVPSVL